MTALLSKLELQSTGPCQERYEDSLRQSATFLLKVIQSQSYHSYITNRII